MFSFKFTFCICMFTLVLPCLCILQDFLSSMTSFGEKNPDYPKKLYFVHFTRKAGSYHEHRVRFSEVTELKQYLQFQFPTILYIHGFIEHYSNESVQTIVDAYLNSKKCNVLALDWSEFSYENYFSVVDRVGPIASHTGKALEELKSTGWNSAKFHIIGHSAGAHIAGLIGRFVKFELPRVTGLDPAGPYFYNSNNDHISNESAKQVDIIHTDGGMYGVMQQTGHVDFYANGGSRLQPGCPQFSSLEFLKNIFKYLIYLFLHKDTLSIDPDILRFCSHHRSWRFFVESVNEPKSFPALQCSSYEDFVNKKCDNKRIILYFGYPRLPDKVNGKYYFTTNDESPFGRQMQGIYSETLVVDGNIDNEDDNKNIDDNNINKKEVINEKKEDFDNDDNLSLDIPDHDYKIAKN